MIDPYRLGRAYSRTFRADRRLKLNYSSKEPDGWPLTRPASSYEWTHILKMMIMRRVPKKSGIHKHRLLQFVHADQLAASDAGRIYVDADFRAMRRTDIVLGLMLNKDRTLTFGEDGRDPEIGTVAPLVYRTPHAEEWLELVPVVIKAVVNYLPTNNLLDLLLTAIEDDEEEADEPPC